jgi:hypothetical protein
MTNIARVALFSQTGNTVSQAATGTSARFSLGRTAPNVAEALLVTVVGADPVFLKLLYADAGTAVTTDRIFLGNSQSVINLPSGVTHAAVISTGTASTLYVGIGNGA